MEEKTITITPEISENTISIEKENVEMIDATLEELTVLPSSEQQIITPTQPKTYYNKVTVEPITTENIEVQSSVEDKIVTSATGKFINKVTVKGDSNLVSENIRAGITILGVDGNLDNVYKPRAILFTDYNGTNLDYELENLSTENMTSMSNMFDGCSGMVSINVSKFNTSKVTTMFNMFASCSKLESIDVSTFNTQVLTNMANMFSYCSKLTSIKFGNINTSKVTNMGGMFMSCSLLPKVDVSRFDTSNVTLMSNMFNGCRAMTEIDVSNFNVEKVTSMNDMFRYCSSLTRLDLSSFTTTKVTNNSTMLDSCINLTTLIIDNPNLFKMTNSNMLNNTPIKNGTGYIYVPDNMVETYKTATNWSVYANQIKGMSELPQEV